MAPRAIQAEEEGRMGAPEDTEHVIERCRRLFRAAEAALQNDAEGAIDMHAYFKAEQSRTLAILEPWSTGGQGTQRKRAPSRKLAGAGGIERHALGDGDRIPVRSRNFKRLRRKIRLLAIVCRCLLREFQPRGRQG